MADFSSSGEDAGAGEHRRAYRVYNPYEHDTNLKPLHELIYDLPTSPDFLFHEEAALRRPGFSDNLFFFTGAGYLSGSFAGAVRGSVEGIRAAEAGETLKIRLSRVLNSSGSAGRKMGNTMGVIGLIFSGMDGLIGWATGSDGVVNTIAAGLGTGAVYKAASGPRSAAVAAAIGGIAAGIGATGKHAAKRYLPI